MRFEAFSPEHLVILGIGVLGVAAMVTGGRRVAGTAAELPTRRALAVVVGAAGVANLGFNLAPADYDVDTSLPFQLCDLATVAAVLGLWSRSRRASAFVYYVGLTLTLQGVLTPSLYQAFPDPRYLGFWVLHLGTIWSAVFLVWGLGIRPSWAGYRFTVAVTAAWAIAALVFNEVADTNYGYLNGKPSAASALDLLGPWPAYVGVEVLLLAGFWSLVMTWPWTRRSAPAG